MRKSHYTCADLAKLKLPGHPTTERRWRNVVEREGWLYIEAKGRGGKGGLRREYLPSEHVTKLITQHEHIQETGAEARQILDARNLARAERRLQDARKTAMATEQLFAQLTPEGQARFDARYDVLLAWRNWFAEQKAKTPKLGRNEAFSHFAEAWNAGQVKASDEARAKYSSIAMRTIQRWVLDNEKGGLAPVADKRAMRGDGKKSVFGQIPVLEKVFIGLLSERPHIKTTHLVELINQCRVNQETGEVLFAPVSYHQVHRYRVNWEKQNAQAHMLNSNPDAWKNKYLSALGNASGDVDRLNQRWEMDGTKADWMLRDGRYNASVVIDVWSRRPMVRFSKTPRTESNKQLLRDAILAWGVPEQDVTDHGSDYISRELSLFFEEMGIEHLICAPFSPWKKPHVERFIQTFQHGILEVLDAFIGHNVADRSAIEAKRSFADNLFKKGTTVEVDLTVEELQALTNAWIDGTYMQAVHNGLGMSPFARVASYTKPIKHVENERALDILLMRPASKPPVIGKTGIRYQKVHYIHEELTLHIGKIADIRLDPNDMGRIYVRVDGRFVCVAENPTLTGISQTEIAARGRAKQAEWAKEERARSRQARKGLKADQLAREIIMERAAKAGKLAHIGRSETHTSAGLQEASHALALDAAPQQSDLCDQLIAEARQIYSEQCNPKAPVLNMAVHRAMGDDNPLSDLTDKQKFELWHELDAVVVGGGELPHPWQQRFHEGFPKTSKFSSMRDLREAFGGEGLRWPAAVGAADRPI